MEEPPRSSADAFLKELPQGAGGAIADGYWRGAGHESTTRGSLADHLQSGSEKDSQQAGTSVDTVGEQLLDFLDLLGTQRVGI